MELLKTDDGAPRYEEDFLLEQDYRQYLLRFETAEVFGRKKKYFAKYNGWYLKTRARVQWQKYNLALLLKCVFSDHVLICGILC